MIHPKKDITKYIGKTISAVSMDDVTLVIRFDDGVKIAIEDNGQCCEKRYMRTDDDIQSLVGHSLKRVDVKNITEGDLDDNDDDDGYYSHEICFVEIGTDEGFITIANHNKHNGCYAGFDLEFSEI